MIMKANKQIGFVYKDNESIDKILKDGDIVFERGFLREKTSTTLPITFGGVGKDLKDYKVYGNTVQNGAPTPDTPIEMVSCGDRTKNLFDKNNVNVIRGTINPNSSTFTPEPLGNNKCFYIPCKANTTYTIQKRNDGDTNRFAIGSSNTIISTSNVTNLTVTIGNNSASYLTITTGANDIYLIIMYYRLTETTLTEQEILDSIQIEEGSINTPYEPYGYKIPVNVNNVITNIYLDEPLRKIDGYSDYIDFINGKVVRNIKEVILDGSENWVTASAGQNAVRFVWNTYQGAKIPSNASTVGDILSDKFIPKTANETANKKDGIAIAESGKIVIYYDLTKDYTTAQFKTWLSSNNVTVDYALATPTEETITLPNIPTLDGNNTLNIETELTPSQVYIKYKSNE